MKINDYSQWPNDKMGIQARYSYETCHLVQLVKAQRLCSREMSFVDGFFLGKRVSQHHNYILMEACLPTSLSRHFALRLKQYLLFLEVTNDLELVQLMLSFLSLKDLLQFLAVSTHFATFKKLQSVELRILRAKLAHLQKPQEPVTWNPFLHLLSVKTDPSVQTKTHKLEGNQKAIASFLQELRYLKDPKRKLLMEGKDIKQKMHQRSDLSEFSKFSEELDNEGKKLEQKLKERPQGWATMSQKSQNQYVFNQYRQLLLSQSQKKLSSKPRKVIPKPKSSPISPLDLLEHHHARMDYERRKARKIQEKEDFIPVQQFKRLAQHDPCSREIFNRVYDGEKEKQQQRNIEKIRMPPTPDPSKIDLEGVQVKVKKLSIAGKMFSGIKSLLTMEEHP